MHRKLSERTVGDCTGGDVDIEMIQVSRVNVIIIKCTGETMDGWQRIIAKLNESQ